MNENQHQPTLVLVAHGTRSPRGLDTIARIAAAVSREVGPTRVAFADVLGPSLSEVLDEVDGPVIVVPAFLASGYHVYTDVREVVARTGRRDVVVTDALGPDVALASLLTDRLRAAGHADGDAVVLAAAGSSDPRALADVEHARVLLARELGVAVSVGYVAAGAPRVPDLVAAVREHAGARVAVASYLLAPGLFHDRLRTCGADVVADPLGVHDVVTRLVAARYRSARVAVHA
ncbi:sirohydrochlorin chelatase [Rhodococcus sp. HNM0569]|uniref:sirohydrochlorin chelatase n=1 Tax=Rhodococcus sp. HNM0569 TaxID=2716340 RepID=UPI00146E3000|nr:sirohydrochlorin chelatase [Rhodococcus sp. HNM0569]NLU81960.1 sirohydrochlorin chelatase [Rhodococcus sp. HNM0569]